MVSFVIKPLEYVPEHIHCVAGWHHQECARQGLRSSLELRQQRLQLHLQKAVIPKTLVAMQSGQAIGCVSLVQYAFNTTENTAVTEAPVWLSNLFVLESARKAGIGTQLIDAAIEYVRRLAHRDLWLSAAECTEFYVRRGWSIERATRLGGRPVNIMRLQLAGC